MGILVLQFLLNFFKLQIVDLDESFFKIDALYFFFNIVITFLFKKSLIFLRIVKNFFFLNCRYLRNKKKFLDNDLLGTRLFNFFALLNR